MLPLWLMSFVIFLPFEQSLPMGGITIASAGGTPTFIAAAANSTTSTILSPIVITYTPSSSSHALYYFVADGTGTISSLTDSTGSPTNISSATWNGGSGAYASYRLSSVSTSAHTITATFSGGATYGILYVVELSNSSASGGTSNSTGTVTTSPFACGSLTASSGSIVLGFGYVFDGGTTLAGGSGPPTFTFPTPSGTPFIFTGIEYSGATTATTYTITSGFTYSGGSLGDAYMCYAVEAKP